MGITMRLLILGATGRTGRQLLAGALEQGHAVTALVRDMSRLDVQHPALTVREGAVTDPGAVEAAMQGQDAVLSALGSASPRELLGTELMTVSIRNVTAAMGHAGVRRIVLLSALGAGESAGFAPRSLRLVFRTAFRAIGRDKAASERILRESDLDWTVVYPPQLSDGPKTDACRHGVEMQVTGMSKVSRADTAHLMLALLDDSDSIRRSVSIAAQ